MEYWRLDKSDEDFLLVFAPRYAIAPEVRAYHLELLNKVRSIPDFHLEEADAIFFKHLSKYYQKIADRLEPFFYCKHLDPKSRHNFFIASEPRGKPLGNGA